jgi:NitT/TauT family transport system ATP-binding protein
MCCRVSKHVASIIIVGPPSFRAVRSKGNQAPLKALGALFSPTNRLLTHTISHVSVYKRNGVPITGTLGSETGGMAGHAMKVVEAREFPAKENLIEISCLEKHFATMSRETVTALTDVNLSAASGEFISIVGPSGCGKTTLLRILAGLERQTSGKVVIAGKELVGSRDDVAVVFQAATLLPWSTVLDNVLLPAKFKGRLTSEMVDRARDLLRLVGLGDFVKKYPFELSGGMQQRVAICRALIRNPSILLMDEPFGALDAMTRESMNVELMRWCDKEQKTVIFITHSIPEAVLLGDRVVMSPRPGRISETLSIDIPRPRDLRTMALPIFGELCDRVRAIFGANASSVRDL